MARKKLPIGYDDFREIREKGFYYIDKTAMIAEFLGTEDKVALIARPRRFGKTLNMTMLREFLDITVDSRSIFQGLSIMETPWAAYLNTRPVIFLSFKNCKGSSAEETVFLLKEELLRAFLYFQNVVKERLDPASYEYENYQDTLQLLKGRKSPSIYLGTCLLNLCRILEACFQKKAVLLIDEYDQPIISSYEYGYHQEFSALFSTLLGAALKGNPSLDIALLSGIQRVAKESIFSQLNNPKVYTVMDRRYAPYFGLTVEETQQLLEDYGLALNADVRRMYDGYRFFETEIYNPWSILNYADSGFLDNYWVNTSSNYLIRQALSRASSGFWRDFDQLASGQDTSVWLNLDTSYVERESNYSLWGLLVNAGYLTVVQRNSPSSAVVRIPNEEVMNEFTVLVTEMAGLEGQGLSEMVSCLLSGDMDGFLRLYQEAVIACTSYMDAREKILKN